MSLDIEGKVTLHTEDSMSEGSYSKPSDTIDCSVIVKDLNATQKKLNNEYAFAHVQDHYSLPASSSTIRFKTANIHVYNQGGGDQFILEERITRGCPQPEEHHRSSSLGNIPEDGILNLQSTSNEKLYITVKSTSHATPGLVLIRVLYSCIALFLPGFFFIMGVGLVLFMIADLVESYSGHSLGYKFFGTLLSLPVLLDGLPHIMVFATMFVIDIFKGSPFILSFGYGIVLTNWLLFVVFIGIPLLVFIWCLMTRNEEVWRITMIASFLSVGFCFVLFGINLSYHRITSCLRLSEQLAQKPLSLPARIRYTIFNAARFYGSGVRNNLYIYESDSYELKEMRSNTDTPDDNTPLLYRSRGTWYIKLTKLRMFKCLFETLDVPQRIWTQADKEGGNLSFFTNSTWSLENIFCRSRTDSLVLIIGGKSALTRSQIKSSALCYYMGFGFCLLIVVAILVWFDVSFTLILVSALLVAALSVPCIIRSIRLTRKLRRVYNHLASNLNDTALIQKWESSIVSRPTERFTSFCLATFILSFAIFPTIHFFTSGNTPGALIFIVVFFFHSEKRYFDSNLLTAQLGSYGTLGKSRSRKSVLRHDGLLGVSSESEWKHKSRLYRAEVMSNGLLNKIWTTCLSACVGLIVVVAIGVVISGRYDANTTAQAEEEVKLPTFPLNATYRYQVPSDYVDSFEDKKIISESNTLPQYLVDYIFLSNMPYQYESDTQPMLDAWFGNGESVFVKDAMEDFRSVYPEYSHSNARYSLITFANSSVAVVSVRGTIDWIDYFADMKLWYSSALFQLYRWAIPFDNVFNPLIEFCISALSYLETPNIQKVAYYSETSTFINYLKESKKYTRMSITGHSLGGGIALITGAQTHIQAIGLSAPNIALGRNTITPPITLEELERYTLIISPERDLFPMIGGRPKHVENIKCRASINSSPVSCHDSWRGLCEMLYSKKINRPVPCRCVLQFGFPEPSQISGGNTTFSEACN